MAATSTADRSCTDSSTIDGQADLPQLVAAHAGAAGLRSGELTHAQYFAAVDAAEATIERLAASEVSA